VVEGEIPLLLIDYRLIATAGWSDMDREVE
jgi:hypothetical protein